MNISLRPHQLVAHWVPGFLLAVLFPTIWPTEYKGTVEPLLPHGEAARGLLLVVLAFVLGEILDAIRDLLENVWDKWSEVWWDFFVRADSAEVERLDNYYFTYYVFDCNLTAPMLLYSLAQLWSGNVALFIVTLVMVFILVANARFLRRELVRLTRLYKDSSRRN